MSRKVIVTGYVPPEPFSTIVVFEGLDDELGEISFGVDHRMARDLAVAVNDYKSDGGEAPVAYLEDWQVMA